MKYIPQIIELADGTKCVYLEDFRRECDEAQVAIRALAEHGESEIQRITKERDEALEESLEQARLLGISGERECRLIAERDEAKKKYDIEATEHMLNTNKQRTPEKRILKLINDLKEMTADRDSWADQCDARIDDVLRIYRELEEANESIKEAWLAMDEIEGTNRINEWQNKNAYIIDTEK